MGGRTRSDEEPAAPVTPPDGWRPRLLADLRALAGSRLFWVGVALKLACAACFGSHFATRWFAPFVYEFVHGRFGNPWEAFLARGEPMAFPYGPGMLVALAPAFAPALLTSFDPAGHVGLLLLRLPLFVADLAILVIVMRWLQTHSRQALLTYWLSPLGLYATYIHGQLDLLPTALLCVALHLLFTRRALAAAAAFGVALATKTHLLIALPFALIYLFRQVRPRFAWLGFGAVVAAVGGAMFALPSASPAFRTMVFASPETARLWSVGLAYGPSGLVLYLAPAGLAIALLRFASYRKLNRDLTTMFLGALYVGFVALVPPQPGWFLWSLPFAALMAARFSRTGRFALASLTAAYLAYFFLEAPAVMFEAADPLLGAGWGARAAAGLVRRAPGLFSAHAVNIAWTVLFSATGITAFEMWRTGVRSNSIYHFRDDTFMVGIGGDSGAGKHTIGRDLAAVMGPSLSLLNGDDDHRWERGHAMWRRYTHLDPRGNLLGAQRDSLAALRRGGDVRKRHYDHDVGRFTDPVLVTPSDFVAIIGLHPFYLAAQRSLLHLKVFVDPDEGLRRAWKVARDVAKRGYAPERVLEEIERRMADTLKFVRPQVRHADLVVRHQPGADLDGAAVNLDLELASALEPLALLDALESATELEVEWLPDDALTNDHLRLRGSIDAARVRALASRLIPNVDELVPDAGAGWQAGGRGLVQLVLLHAISARMRRESTIPEVS